MTVTQFALNPALDRVALAQCFRDRGHVCAEGFLDAESARALAQSLAARDDWHWVINAGDKVFDFDRKAREVMNEATLTELRQRVDDAARGGFQFRYSAIRVPDAAQERRAREDILHRFATFMSSAPVLDLITAISGQDQICFADAQATAYHSGDFLTGHNDDVAGKDRRLAYVMGLTPQWRVEWGGLLLFHQEPRQISGLMPQFNCLNLFAIPVQHSVSQVTSFAGAVRHSVTGWFRSKMPVYTQSGSG